MSKPPILAEMASLRDAAVDDVMEMSDEELHALLQENGENLKAIASSMKSEMREAAARVVREQTKPATSRNESGSVSSVIRPSIDKIKRLVRDVCTREPGLSLAFREGKAQTDADLQSLYDDLVATGALKPDDHET